MSRLEILDYNRETFPIAGILEDLTEEIRGGQLQPLEAYIRTEEELAAHGLSRCMIDYDSTAITTVGHLRRPGIDEGEGIQANMRTARLAVGMLAVKGDIRPQDTMLPVDLGKTGWSQAEYMAYWAFNIGGPDVHALSLRPQGLSLFEVLVEKALEQNEVDLEVMTSSQLSRDERRPQYIRFAQAYAEAIMSSRVPNTPVRRFVQLVDTGVSLGCDAENRLRQALGIDGYRLAAVTNTAVETLPVPTLSEDLRVIMAHGGEVLVAPPDSMLTLVRV